MSEVPVMSGSEGVAGAGPGVKWLGQEKRPAVCWQYNEGMCPYGQKCRFPHMCEGCGGGHPKSRCTEGGTKKARLF